MSDELVYGEDYYTENGKWVFTANTCSSADTAAVQVAGIVRMDM